MTTVIKDWDTVEQCELFEAYLEETADVEERQRVGKALGYNEEEWHAFQYGWNAAKTHFGIET